VKKIIASIIIVVMAFCAAVAEATTGGLAHRLNEVKKQQGELEEEQQSAESNITPEKEEVDPWLNVSNWEKEHGYTFPFYGKTSVDLSPISDFLSLLESNNIYIPIQEILITNNRKDYEGHEHDYISAKIGDTFYLTYICYLDGSKIRLSLEVPRTYRPMDEALKLLIVSVLSVEYDEAEKMLQRLYYNVIDERCEIETSDYYLLLIEPRYSNGALVGFVSLTVEKK
jgi:hypothetical protein